MQPSREDILGKQNPDRRIGVILAHTKKPDGLAVIDLLHELGLKSKDRSGLNDNHLKKLVKEGLLEECQAIPEHGEQKKKRQLDAHRLNQDLDTFAELLRMFVGTEYEEEFLKSAYAGSFSTNDLEICLQVRTTICDKLKTVQLLCNTFYPDSPMAKTLDSLFAPDPLDDLTAEELYDTVRGFFAVISVDADDICTMFMDFFERREAERIASSRPRGATMQESLIVRSVLSGPGGSAADQELMRQHARDMRKKQLPPPVITVQTPSQPSGTLP